MNWRTSLGCLLILVSLTGCSSFNSRWQQVNAQQPAAPTNLTGAWDGHWRSDMNGHNGRLRDIFTDGEPGTSTPGSMPCTGASCGSRRSCN